MAQMVKNPPAMQKTQVQSLGQKDPLEKEMVPTLQVFLPGEFHGQRSLVSYSPWGPKQSDTTEQLTHTHKLCFIWSILVSLTGSWKERYTGYPRPWPPKTIQKTTCCKGKYCSPAESTEAHLAHGSLKPQTVYFFNYKQSIYENKILLLE